MATLLTNKPQ